MEHADAACERGVVRARDEEVARLHDLHAGKRGLQCQAMCQRSLELVVVWGTGRGASGGTNEVGDSVLAAPGRCVAQAGADFVAVVHELADHVAAGVTADSRHGHWSIERRHGGHG